jgi:hypothetical protein
MSTVIGYAEGTHAGGVSFRGERVNHRSVLGFLAVAVVVAVGALGLWFYESSQLQEVHARVVAGELQPIAALVKEDQALIKELQAEPFTEKD